MIYPKLRGTLSTTAAIKFFFFKTEWEFSEFKESDKSLKYELDMLPELVMLPPCYLNLLVLW